MNQAKSTSPYIDTLSIGFGPAGLALACVFDEAFHAQGGHGMRGFLALEKAQDSAWHPNLLLHSTDINHHVYRDLVTPRNPQSPYSFAMYLKEKNRLFKFGLLGRPASRFEWSDYMTWVGAKLAPYVRYDHGVQAIEPLLEDGELVSLRVKGDGFSYETRKLILSNGSTPNVPDLFARSLGSHVFHASEYLQRLAELKGNMPRRWLVLGSGQSAGEVVADLIQQREDIHVTSVHRSIGFKVAQLGQFPNLVFLPERIEYFKRLDDEGRSRFFNHVKGTNYSGIDVDESQHLYSLIYEDEIAGRERLSMAVSAEVLTFQQMPDGYQVTLRDVFTGEVTEHVVDAIVLGTGYRQAKIPPLLEPLEQYLVKDSQGGLQVNSQYQVALRNSRNVQVYVNGLSERTHGISDGQSFSAVAYRAGVIHEALLSSVVEPVNYSI